MKWQFPVGKVEAGESKEEALVRKIEEGLVVEIHELQYLITMEHSYPDFHLTMHACTCSLKAREVEWQEHVGLKWLAVEELDQLDWAAADVPVVEYLKKNHVINCRYISGYQTIDVNAKDSISRHRM